MDGRFADDERFMREALAQARAAAKLGEVPIGAVVVHEGRVIARAHNRRELDEDPSAHAEFAAMIEASRVLGRWRLTGCTVYVTLEPCLMCAGLMVNARIDRCVYGAPDPKGGAVGTLYDVSHDSRLNHAFDVSTGVLAGECAAVLREFFQGLRAARKRAAEEPAGEGLPPAKAARLAEGLPPEEGALPAESLPPAGAPGQTVTAVSALPAPAVPAPTVPASGALAAPAEPAQRVVLAIDTFKGSASSAQVEAWLAEGMRAADPALDIVAIPMADGGEGTVDAFRVVLGGEMHDVEVAGPNGAPRTASYLMVHDAQTGPIAVIETAHAAGIGLSARTNEAALLATTQGVGELMLAAVKAGARTLYLGLGGSATTDGGAGMLRALGARVACDAGREITPGLAGLRDAVEIDLAPARTALAGVRLKVLSDVASPLVGPRGAVRVFGPQKGLGAGLIEAEREELLRAADRWMAAYGARLTAARDALDGTSLQVAAPGARPKSLAGVPGAGAAGGLGAALLALGAELSSGADALLGLTCFDEAARGACAVVTGEGSVDAQTGEGKVPTRVARRAKAVAENTPVFAICGSRVSDLGAVYAEGVDAVLPIGMGPQTYERALDPEQVRANLAATGETIVRLIGLSC